MASTMRVLIFVAILFMNSDETLASDPDPLADFCVPDPTAPVKTACKNPKDVKVEDFITPCIRKHGEFTDIGLAMTLINPTNFPGSNTLGMSFSRADYIPGGVNPPHSHPRATEAVYVVQGKMYAGFVDSTSRIYAKDMEQGDLMLFPKGLTHFMMNVGQENAIVFAAFTSQNPGIQKSPSVIFGSGINEMLLQRSFGIGPQSLANLRLKYGPKIVK